MKGVLLVNSGSPQSVSENDVRIYLREFLMDGKVMDVPWLLRKMIVELGILPKRPKFSAQAYRKIWLGEGSPLVVISRQLAEKVSGKLTGFPVELAMRYQEPSIKNGLQRLSDRGVDEVLIIPLYPEYSMSTTESVIEKCREVQKSCFRSMRLEFMQPFYNDDKYLDVLSNHIKQQLPPDVDLLLFSYHGIPERHIHKTDPYKKCRIDDACCFEAANPSHTHCYRHQCYFVTGKVSERLGLDKSKVMQTFQSRLGQSSWLQPYTDRTLEQLPRQGIKKIAVVAPAFVSDCLETLEELAVAGRKLFRTNGGEEFHYINCLNDDDRWAEWIAEKISRFST